jgi:hypothetical protein
MPKLNWTIGASERLSRMAAHFEITGIRIGPAAVRCAYHSLLNNYVAVAGSPIHAS